MKRAIKWTALAAFLAWEAWWAYVFFRAPVPDYEMKTVFALLMGIVLPLALGLIAGLIAGIVALVRLRS